MLRILVIIFVIFALSRAFLRFKDKSISFRELLFWLVIWTIAIVLIFEPDISNYAARFLGMGRGADTIFFLAIVFLFYSIFRLYVKMDRMDKDITDLAIKISKDLHKEQK